MFSKIQRLPLEFNNKFQGKRINTPHLLIIAAPNQNLGNRFAVVVSKKVSKSAVVRNRLKRRLRAALRLQTSIDQLNLDLLCIVKSSTHLPSFKQFSEEIYHILRSPNLHDILHQAPQPQNRQKS